MNPVGAGVRFPNCLRADFAGHMTRTSAVGRYTGSWSVSRWRVVRAESADRGRLPDTYLANPLIPLYECLNIHSLSKQHISNELLTRGFRH